MIMKQQNIVSTNLYILFHLFETMENNMKGGKNKMNQKIIGIIAGIFVAIIVLGAIGFVYAQQSGNKTNNSFVKGAGFVDTNNDGVCDNAASCPNHNANSTQGCQGNKQSGEKGKGFVDANNNGICDHMESGEVGQGNHDPANCPMRNK
jgi:hypothetical protein